MRFLVTAIFIVSIISPSYGKSEKCDSWKIYHDAFAGASVGAMKNAAQYIVEIGGRSSNVVNIFDKYARSSLGNPKWFARVDMPHGKVNFPHINVNKAITGVKDPHIPISHLSAHAAGATGQVLNVVNKAAPYLVAASFAKDALDIVIDVAKGDSNKAVEKVVDKTLTYGGGYIGSTAGASIGTIIFPGVGTMVGGIVGGAIGGMLGGGQLCAEKPIQRKPHVIYL